ncbi:hypothetical protein Ga0080574_TMP330 (plasmid) [Salipiger abyssi]|uniref:Uncharacterized protein n=1 Tax=Salipiger abyssi TaxID=1250539 RepID=A0A1P8UMN3_9RHOB|nr:hypothetical protein Ga0080574_TMP330 [Salipiger abyssi]
MSGRRLWKRRRRHHESADTFARGARSPILDRVPHRGCDGHVLEGLIRSFPVGFRIPLRCVAQMRHIAHRCAARRVE